MPESTLREPTFDELKSQIMAFMVKYHQQDPKVAALSGMMLTASFLAKLDGSKTMTAAVVLRAIQEVGLERGYIIGRMGDG